MPQYLAPGVYVEETPSTKSIEGVSTSTAGFVGLTRRGPVADPDSGNLVELITSFGDFERIYGGLENLEIGEDIINYLAHSVRAFFNEGGGRLYVSRVYLPPADDDNGIASVSLGNGFQIDARFPGSAYNGKISFAEVSAPAANATLAAAPEGTLLRASGGSTGLFLKGSAGWQNSDQSVTLPFPLADGTTVEILSLNVVTTDADGNELAYEGLGFGAAHPRSLGKVLTATPNRRSDYLQNLYAMVEPDGATAFALHDTLFGGSTALTDGEISLGGGSDGASPTANAFKSALDELAGLEDISIVAAPGYSAFESEAVGIQKELISHAERRRSYRIAVLDTLVAQSVSQARVAKSEIDSKYAALYYPWVTVANPLFRPGNAGIAAEIDLPPSGFVAGIYARNDVERGVFKAPANEVVRGALRFEREVNFAEQEVLNPAGVNCLRFFPGRGYRVWGARTISSDPEWKYVNIRRYFNYLEQSIDRGTQWAVFEPNGPQLWTNVRDTISAFLYNEWISGALLGESVNEAFFVKCDRSTMTQNDLDNGRLICLIGVAVVKPAEFVIFRISQKTADVNV
ncbi:phage tail sheath subtilisin-like domain-containing protein [cf. Phormidesmis sp. LEGE 11477]|uniref:phage tail sheath subtilisin-like domain-containing protein n=1 Tax=cf. Phormidesmis sp. LEGE 11477 TaxID=1828680 RepID=UPI001880B84F|nr:phage tail sheath subtilisin-like domain-containing protein [cf. Phormidesmis sp. LEGE 11477]MBE9064693.1 phage tail sheath subtilisin-like domain-containing protein [cf. Phormidesmis sp. LEGE 11477]